MSAPSFTLVIIPYVMTPHKLHDCLTTTTSFTLLTFPLQTIYSSQNINFRRVDLVLMTFRPSSEFPTPEVLQQNLQQLKNGTVSWICHITEI
jgi:hypothetical protein